MFMDVRTMKMPLIRSPSTHAICLIIGQLDIAVAAKNVIVSSYTGYIAFSGHPTVRYKTYRPPAVTVPDRFLLWKKGYISKFSSKQDILPLERHTYRLLQSHTVNRLVYTYNAYNVLKVRDISDNIL